MQVPKKKSKNSCANSEKILHQLLEIWKLEHSQSVKQKERIWQSKEEKQKKQEKEGVVEG